ncbi:MAG TPA: signal recognition particle protein [Gammaproteobacteria bacterium]|jgi:signal recognition particle subunit SRP54|nr:signal recognition particle protein [Gammaproteobacteria bacterium]
MFDSLSERLTRTLDLLRGSGRLTEANVRDALRDVRMALLEADVALPVVKSFTELVRERALGTEVLKSLTPGQAFIKIVHDELLRVMDEGESALNLNVTPPAVILLAGLQGAGKTTSAAKLARVLKEQSGKRILLVSTDVYRPAAREQLQRLAAEIKVDCFTPENDEPVAIAALALDEARKRLHDVLIVDTAGRLHVDAGMMQEAQQIHAAVSPSETLFVVDAMAGQDAANAAAAFGATLPLTGIILTKTDGDARGGVALSARHIIGAPIKFMGVGEKVAALEAFHPERLVSRILGMGDVLSLVEQAQQNVDHAKAEKLANKLRKGKGFDLEDFRDQLQQMQNMGGLSAMLDKLPGAGKIPEQARAQFDDKDLRRQVAIINSMTAKERRKPDLLNGSRRRRIAAGSGTQVQDVNRLLKQYVQLEKVMKKMKGGGMAKMLRGFQGRLPPGS